MLGFFYDFYVDLQIFSKSTFFKNSFRNTCTCTWLKCKTNWIQVRPEFLSGLFWVQTVVTKGCFFGLVSFFTSQSTIFQSCWVMLPALNTSTKQVKVSCSRKQHSDLIGGESLTSNQPFDPQSYDLPTESLRSASNALVICNHGPPEPPRTVGTLTFHLVIPCYNYPHTTGTACHVLHCTCQCLPWYIKSLTLKNLLHYGDNA